jgi:hypothetical protein
MMVPRRMRLSHGKKEEPARTPHVEHLKWDLYEATRSILMLRMKDEVKMAELLKWPSTSNFPRPPLAGRAHEHPRNFPATSTQTLHTETSPKPKGRTARQSAKCVFVMVMSSAMVKISLVDTT